MRLTGYEIKKLMTQIPAMIAFIDFLWESIPAFMISEKKYLCLCISAKDQYIAFCEGNEQADELGFYEADLEEQKRYLDSYREFISQMQDRSKAMENVISEGNHYLTDVSARLVTIFGSLKASVTVDNCFGIKALAEYQYGIFFAISFQGVLTWYLLFFMRNRKLFYSLLKDVKMDIIKRRIPSCFLLLSGEYCIPCYRKPVLFVPEMDVWIWQYEQTRTGRFLFSQLPVCIKRRARPFEDCLFFFVGLSLLTGSVLFYGGHAGEIGNGSFHCHDASYDMKYAAYHFIVVTWNPAGMGRL